MFPFNNKLILYLYNIEDTTLKYLIISTCILDLCDSVILVNLTYIKILFKTFYCVKFNINYLF